MYLDEAMGFFDAVGGGKRDKKSLAGFILGALNPLTRTNANMKAGKGYDGNLKGEGLITGGLLVMRQGGELVWGFHEQAIGARARARACLERPCPGRRAHPPARPVPGCAQATTRRSRR